MTGVFIRERQKDMEEKALQTEAEAGVTHGRRKPGNSCSQQNLEEARTSSPLGPSESAQPVDTLILDFWHLELWDNKFVF